MKVRTVLVSAAASAVAAIASPASAALSPLFESVREIEAILQDPRLAQSFPNQDGIISIEVSGMDSYEIGTGTCSVTVKVVDVPKKPGEQTIVGPRQFTLEFSGSNCVNP
jgi:hypothetical protein